MTGQSRGTLMIGAGHAGGTCAALLRQFGYAHPITLMGDEPHLPYQRPPLSKAWLKGEADADSLALRGFDFYEQANITVLTGVSASAIDRDTRSVTIHDGRSMFFDKLVIATGARPILPGVPGIDLRGVLTLRSASDAEHLKLELLPGRRIVVIGGGYIGLEVAASARALGASVTIVEREERLLKRSGSTIIADFFRQYHQRRGVEILLGRTVVGFEGTGGQVRAVALTDGSTIPCDVALVAVGIRPNSELAEMSALPCAGGIIVDRNACTIDPNIYAIGDVTRRPVDSYGIEMRLESVPNALEQAKQAAAAITGRPAPHPEVPWNWSDQYDIKLQLAGLPIGVAQTVTRGHVEGGAFSVFHLGAEGTVQLVESVNAPGDFMGGRKLIESRRKVSVQRLGNSDISLKELLKAEMSDRYSL